MISMGRLKRFLVDFDLFLVLTSKGLQSSLMYLQQKLSSSLENLILYLSLFGARLSTEKGHPRYDSGHLDTIHPLPSPGMIS